MNIYDEDASNPLNQNGVTETMNVLFLLIIPTAILFFAWNDFRKDSNEILLLVLYSGCIFLYLFISYLFKIGENHKTEIIHLKKCKYLEGDEVPYLQYVDNDGVIKDSEAWRILYDDAIKQYRYDKCYPNYSPIRIVATNVGDLRLMYFVPNIDKDINDWEYGYLKTDNDAVVLRSVLEYFGEEGYQVAKNWLSVNIISDEDVKEELLPVYIGTDEHGQSVSSADWLLHHTSKGVYDKNVRYCLYSRHDNDRLELIKFDGDKAIRLTEQYRTTKALLQMVNWCMGKEGKNIATEYLNDYPKGIIN